MEKIKFTPPQLMLNRDEVDDLLEDLLRYRHDPHIVTGIDVKPGSAGRIQLQINHMLANEQGEIVAVLGGCTLDREAGKWRRIDKSESARA